MDRFVGQWQGTGTNGVYSVVNVEVRRRRIQGRIASYSAVMIDGAAQWLWLWSKFTAEVTPEGFRGEAGTASVHYRNGDFLTDESLTFIKSKVPDFTVPSSTEFTAVLTDEDTLSVSWSSKNQAETADVGEVELTKKILKGSTVSAKVVSWNDFKDLALKQEDGVVFRGQARHWPLQTSFHRTGQADLVSYLDNEVVELERLLNVHTEHVYNIGDDRSLGALLNLAQHHGYPTPLLDWTRSPFVAAFFAFEDSAAINYKGGAVTIFMFDEEKWTDSAGRLANIRSPALTLRTLELPSYGNSRVLPQQSTTMFSNVNGIEEIIKSNESEPGELISAVRIPASDREKAMRDLSKMGITWGALFPGLDGMCRQLGFKHFAKG